MRQHTRIEYCLENYRNTIEFSDLSGELADYPQLYSDVENSAPVAGLSLVVANPDTLLDGKPTTETTIFWLWKDSNNVYTYDPDGDALTLHFSGINEYVVGNVTLGGEVVGIATTVTVAAEYFVTYYAVDANNTASNVVSYHLEVEPSDGNKRPVCIIAVSKINPKEGTNVIFDWTQSYDPNGDALTSLDMQVSKDGGSYERVNNKSDYFVSSDNYTITLSFKTYGTYKFRISMKDAKGAWSNWVGGDIHVRERYPEPIISTLSSTTYEDSRVNRWKEGYSTASNGMYIRMNNIHVYTNYAREVIEYKNRNGTYNNVLAYPVAPDTVFMCLHEQRSKENGNFSYGTDPYFGEKTPRALTEDEIIQMYNNGVDNMIIYDPKTGTIIDFYSPLNTLIGYNWDKPSITYGYDD